jgi:hypothetical protein
MVSKEMLFPDRIYMIYKILSSHFQFPDETENTQSPPANKIGTYNLVVRLVGPGSNKHVWQNN